MIVLGYDWLGPYGPLPNACRARVLNHSPIDPSTFWKDDISSHGWFAGILMKNGADVSIRSTWSIGSETERYIYPIEPLGSISSTMGDDFISRCSQKVIDDIKNDRAVLTFYYGWQNHISPKHDLDDLESLVSSGLKVTVVVPPEMEHGYYFSPSAWVMIRIIPFGHDIADLGTNQEGVSDLVSTLMAR